MSRHTCVPRALQTSLALPISSLEPSYHLKITGIAILLASVAEEAGRPQTAYKVLQEALDRMELARGVVTHEEADPPLPAAAPSSGDESALKLTIEDRFRGVSIGMTWRQSTG